MLRQALYLPPQSRFPLSERVLHFGTRWHLELLNLAALTLCDKHNCRYDADTELGRDALDIGLDLAVTLCVALVCAALLHAWRHAEVLRRGVAEGYTGCWYVMTWTSVGKN